MLGTLLNSSDGGGVPSSPGATPQYSHLGSTVLRIASSSFDATSSSSWIFISDGNISAMPQSWPGSLMCGTMTSGTKL